MKTSTSFAILALLASAGSALAAPLPLPHHGGDVKMYGDGNGEHLHTSSNGSGSGRHHHARSGAPDPAPASNQNLNHQGQGQTVGMGALATASVNTPQGQPNASGNGKGNSKSNSRPVGSILTSTSSSRKNAAKPVASMGDDTGKTLSNPGSKSGQIGHLGSTADDALQPETTKVAKTLPRRAQNDVVGSAVKQGKPIETAATGINKNANVGNVGSVANGKGDLLIVGGIVKPLTASDAPLPQVTTGVLNGKVTNGLVGSTDKLLSTGTTGSLNGGKGSVINTSGGNKIANTQGTTNGVGKLPDTVNKSLNFDPLANDAATVNTDSTESHAQKQSKQTTNHAANSGPNQNANKVNNLAFSGNGTNHRADPRPANGGVSTSQQIVGNSTQTATKNTDGGGNTSSQIVGVKPDDNKVNTNNGGNVGSSAQRGGNQALNSTTRPADPLFDAALPASKSNGSLLTVTSQDANGKVAQTPGKSNKVAEANSNDVTGSKDKNQNINVKVATPQQAQAGSSTVSGPTGGNGSTRVVNTSGGKTVGPSDQKGSVVQQAQDGILLKQDVVATAANSHSAPHPGSQSRTKSSPPHSSTTHASSSSSSVPVSAASSASVKPQVYVAQTATSAASSSAITSPAVQSSDSARASPVAQANVQSGTVKVNKNQGPTSIIQLAATSSLPLQSNVNVNSIASSAAPSASAVVNKAIDKPRQAQVSYGQKGEHVVACDGQNHSIDDVVDECISADLLDFRPSQTEACPTDMQHNIEYGASTNQLNDNAAAQEIQKYVRLCLTANSL
ncbi:hypothetical protein I317_00777 [Kwoniella heveanensis CBS 569]|nr:hypothetical protein I317_00777 [Kwoniella heveanensis CBS 569]